MASRRTTVLILTLLLAFGLTACERNTPLVYELSDTGAAVSVVFEEPPTGERAASSYALHFTITVEETGEEIHRELRVSHHEPQGLLELPAATDVRLEARARIYEWSYWGEYFDVVRIEEGEVTSIELFMMIEDDH